MKYDRSENKPAQLQLQYFSLCHDRDLGHGRRCQLFQLDHTFWQCTQTNTW